MWKKLMNHKKGFSLVELIVVLVIMAILAALLIPSLTGYIEKSKEKSAVEEARQVTLAAESGYVEWFAKHGDKQPNNGDRPNIGNSILEYTKTDCGITRYSPDTTGSNLLCVLTYAIPAGHWKNNFWDAKEDGRRGGNRATVYVGKGFIWGILYMTKDRQYVVATIITPCADFPETGAFVEKVR